MGDENGIQAQIQEIRTGKKKAIAQAIDTIENESEAAYGLLDALHAHIGGAQRVGITGPPGSGKSTFTNRLVQQYRFSGRRVGVIAVDPSSPLTGGALFGDRLRMKAISSDPEVFIRSMATRGSPGGLARQVTEVADILDAAGKDIIIYETVGVGQIELDIVSAADTIVVIAMPQAGDTVQCMKAGLMEIGHLFVVNKADLPGAQIATRDIENMLLMRLRDAPWRPVVRQTDALRGKGFEKIVDDIDSHFCFLRENGILITERHRQKCKKLQDMVNDYLIRRFWTQDRLDVLSEHVERAGSRFSVRSMARIITRNLEKRVLKENDDVFEGMPESQ